MSNTGEPAVIEELMGHAQVDTALNVYTQVVDGSLRRAPTRSHPNCSQPGSDQPGTPTEGGRPSGARDEDTAAPTRQFSARAERHAERSEAKKRESQILMIEWIWLLGLDSNQ